MRAVGDYSLNNFFIFVNTAFITIPNIYVENIANYSSRN